MKAVIYTCLTGGYDHLPEPKVIDKRFTYICFTDHVPQNYKGIWEFRAIPIALENKQLLSRYAKLMPYKVLGDFDCSLYIDANMQIVDAQLYQRFITLYEQGVLFASVKHFKRKCIYREALRVIELKKDTRYKRIMQQMKLYKKNGFPKNWGMYEAGILFRRHNDSQIIRQSKDWWSLLQNYSHRDQLSLTYTLWKAKLPFFFFLEDGKNVHTSPWFNFIPHKNEKAMRGLKKFLVKRNYELRRLFFYPIYKAYLHLF
jgi:hypothetical protein